ncbi:MAG TPA: DNA polymerase III subunit delta [Caulobacteraceae bacterium]|jgi:DNA polymerase-3 subunit delta|nr:DNA polymerase III subunit delta [Caulobacteraceae bacterium]
MDLRRRPDIERFLAAPGREFRAALIHGRDTGVVRERAQQLAAASTERPDDPFDAALITEADLDAAPARLEEELAAVSMLGGRRLVRLRLSDGGAKVERAAAEALAGHLEGRFNPDAFFLIEAGDLSRDSALRRAAEKAPACAAVICYEDEPGDIARLTRQALAAEGLGLTSDAVELFVARLPHERGVARQEIERLILFLGPGSGRTAGSKDLDDFLGVEPEASLAQAASDAFGGRLGPAHAGLRRAAREGQGGAAAVRLMGLHLATLRRIAVAQGAGASLPEAVKAARVFFKNEREVSRQARAWVLDELGALQPEILTADLACKSTGSPDELIAERLALTIAARAKRLGL